jgi:hypothetical protein
MRRFDEELSRYTFNGAGSVDTTSMTGWKQRRS